MATVNPGYIINKAYKGYPNIMTPTVIEYGWISEEKQTAYELSKGDGIPARNQRPPTIYGVTVARYSPATGAVPDYDLSKCLHSPEEAREYIAQLKKDIRK